MSKPLSKKKEISSHQIFDLPCTKEWELKHGICSSNRQILISLILSFNCFSTSWHALLVWFSVFILSADPSPCSTCDSVWRSLYFSRPVFFCAPCSSTILSGRQKKKQNPTYRGRMGHINPHSQREWTSGRCMRIFTLHLCDPQRSRLSQIWIKPSDMIVIQRGSLSRKWPGFNPRLLDWPLARKKTDGLCCRWMNCNKKFGTHN